MLCFFGNWVRHKARGPPWGEGGMAVGVAWPLQFRAGKQPRSKCAAGSTTMPQSVFKPNWLLSICNWEEIHMNGHVAKLAMAGSFGIALLGLYLIIQFDRHPNEPRRL